MASSLVVAVLAITSLTQKADAHLVTPEGNLQVGFNDTQKTMDGVLGDNVDLLWKWDQGGSTSGSGFNVTFNSAMTTATLSWDLTGTGMTLEAVAWKGGTLINGYSSNLGFYWSTVTDSQTIKSDGDTINLTIDLSPDFKTANSWSHIAFYGTTQGQTPPENVPDGGTTLALVGIALTGIGLVRRKLL